MDVLGGEGLGVAPLSGSIPSGPNFDVTLTPIDLTLSLIELGLSETLALTPVDLTLSLIDPVTVEWGDTRLFSFPDISGFQTAPFISPGWTIHFYESGAESLVGADPGFNEIHSHPVKVDRYGTEPTIYVNYGTEYRLTIKNEYGITKFDWGSYQWPNTVEDHVDLTAIDLTLSLVELSVT